MLSAQVRVRQHVNPLASRFQAPLNLPPGWYADSFTDPSAPLHLDIGCGKGRWAATAAAACPGVNYLGIEIRAPLVDQANGWAAAAAAAAAAAGGSGARNVAYLAANANVVLSDLLSAHIPSGVLASASVQFPDPHFKRRHRKRRTLTLALATALASAMPPGGPSCPVGGGEALATGGGERAGVMWTPATGTGAVWRAGAVEVEATTEAEAAAPPGSRPSTNREWLVDNPTGMPTEREVCVLRDGGAVYRQLYVRV
ncbi:hypothetical protein MMPV_002228 [Pyropia vietnamensis]